MSDDYLWDRSGADPEIAKLEELLAPLAYTEVRKSKRRYWIAGGALAAAAVMLVAILAWPRAQAGFQYSGAGGSGVLRVGGTLDTEGNTAELAIAEIGTAQLGTHTRVRLERTSAERHQLYLEQGTLHARVKAPPRLFAVSTASTEVTDLGCEYEIAVDPTGTGTIRVLGGKVELDEQGGVIVAPAGTHAAIHPGRRPGYPIGVGASEAFEAAVADYERGVAGALDRLLAEATVSDAITLVNLAIIEPGRVDVLRRLGEITAAPDGITVAKAIADPAARGMWREAVVNAQIHVGDWMQR